MTEYVYFIEIEAPVEVQPVKVGRAIDVHTRLQGLACSSPWPLRLIRVVPVPPGAEARLHEFLAPDRMSGEWFRPGFLLDTVLAMTDEQIQAQQLRVTNLSLWAKGEIDEGKPAIDFGYWRRVFDDLRAEKQQADRDLLAAIRGLREAGVSIIEIAAEIGVTRQAVYDFLKRHPEPEAV